MTEKSNYNMIISIINATIVVPIIVLSLIFQNNTLTRVLLSIYGAFAITYYILKSIMYHKEESTSKTVLDRISNSFFDVLSTLVIINFCLLLPNGFKWIFFGMLIFECILEIIIDSLDKVLEVKYLLAAAKVITMIFILLALYPLTIVVALGIISIIGFYINHLLGRILQNKLILSFDLISLVLFGIFLILI